MKKNIQNLVTLIFLSLSNIIIGQGPNPDDAGGGVNPTDMQAPIDANIFILGLMAIIFAYFIYSKKTVQSSR